jgi:ABC-type Fe3+/spermidine/putrescine transport system ATPase subunit
MPDIALENVCKRFGGVVALDDLSLEIKGGEYNVVVGPSGCGKTTLLKTIAGLVRPDSGRVLIDGVDVTDVPPEERGIGFFFQSYALFPHLTVRENVEYGLKIRGVPVDERSRKSREILGMVGLSYWVDHHPYELSGGMQQRVALARALSIDSKVLLLDEPLSALDAKLGLILRESLVKLAKKLGATVVHVTPNQEEALDVAEKIILMRKGRIVQVGSDYEIYNNPIKPFSAYFLGESNFIPARKVSDFEASWNGFIIRTSKCMSSEKVLLAVRTEKVLFERRKKNTFDGVVESINFLGKVVRYEVDVHGRTFVVQTAKHPEIKLNDRVLIHIPPDDVVVFENFDGSEYNLTFD